MNKILLGVIGLLISSALNIGFLFPSKVVKNSNNLSILLIRLSFILAGLISLVSMFIPGLEINKDILSNIKKYIDYKLVLFFAIILFIMYISIILAVNKGGPVTFVIINMNLLSVILYGIFFMKDPYDFKLILAFIVYVLAGAFTVIHQNKLKKK